MKDLKIKEEGVYEYIFIGESLQKQLCPMCRGEIGIMPGSRDAICHNCGYKDPCCE